MDSVLDALDITVDAQGATIDQAIMIVANGGTNILFDTTVNISGTIFVDRITADEAYARVTNADALIVCAYIDNACESITI